MLNNLERYSNYIAMGHSGRQEDVDALMNRLSTNNDLATVKLVDYALSLIKTKEGIRRIKHFLFNGSQLQRNYAALYFKRNGKDGLLKRAVRKGLIDHEQAYAK